MRSYAELQSKQRATYGDDEEAREAAGKQGGVAPRGSQGVALALNRLGGTPWLAVSSAEVVRAPPQVRPPRDVRPEAYRKNGVCFRRKRGLVGLL
jgi:hypothetical protein